MTEIKGNEAESMRAGKLDSGSARPLIISVLAGRWWNLGEKMREKSLEAR